MITVIASVAANRVIGKAGGQPLYLKEDLARFKQLTSGGVVVMGRKTFEAILKKLGKPLPNRTNIVVTRQKDFSFPGCVVCHSVEEALGEAEKTGKQIFVIGGAQLFEQTLPLAERLELTEIHEELDGDVFFPAFDKKVWREVSREESEEGGVKFSFVTYEKCN